MIKKVIGLNISNESISAVLVTCGINGNFVEKSKYLDIPDTGGFGTEEFQNRLTDMLKELGSDEEIDGARCVVSIPSDCFSYRNISVPFKNEKKIRQILPFELEPALPFSTDNYQLEFQHVRTYGKNEVLAVIGDNRLLEAINTVLKELNLVTEIILPGGYAQATLHSFFPDTPDDFLWVDCGIGKSTIVLFLNNNAVMIRSVAGGVQDPSLLGLELNRTLSAFEEQTGIEYHPGLIISSGTGSEDPGVIRSLEASAGVSLRNADFLENVKGLTQDNVDKRVEIDKVKNAIALTLVELNRVKCINFSSGVFSPLKYFNENRDRIMTTGILFAVVFITGLLSLFTGFYKQEKTLEQLNQGINQVFLSTFPDARRIKQPGMQLREMKVRVRDAKNQMRFASGNAKKVKTIDVLNEISRSIPVNVNVEMTRMVADQESIVISGYTDTYNSVNEIQGKLGSIEFFKKVQITSSNKDRTGKKVRFTIKVQR